MLKLLKPLVVGLVFSATNPANASSLSYDFFFTGTVQSAVEVSSFFSSFPNTTKNITSIVGQPFTASFQMAPAGPVASGIATLQTDFPHNHIFITPVYVYSNPPPGAINQGPTGISVYGGASFDSNSAYTYSGSVGPLSFTYDNGLGSVLLAPVHVSSVMEADDQGTLFLTLDTTSASLSVSPVPLPPALPMFAAALLALGIFGVYARRRLPFHYGEAV
jgi:hypothetical protein